MFHRAPKKNLCVISFSPTLARLVLASEPRRGYLKLAKYLFHLPKGCINEVTGEVEDPSCIIRFLESIKISQKLKPRSVLSLQPDIIIILPSATCYHLTIPLEESDKRLDTQALLKRYSKLLPGDPTKLILAGYADPEELNVKGKRELSIFAARESAVLGYTRLLVDNLCQIQSVFPTQVARFNRILLERPEVTSKRILNLDTSLHGGEITLWDCGAIIASESRAESKERSYGDSSKRVGVEFIGEHPEVIANEVLRFLAKPELLGRAPSEVVITGGHAKLGDLVRRLGEVLRVPVSQTLNKAILPGYTISSDSNDGVAVKTEVFAEVFDDLLGVIIAKYREINLLPRSIMQRRSGLARATWLARPLVYAAGGLIGSLFLYTITALFSCQGNGSEVLKAKDRIAELRSSISAKRGDLERLTAATRSDGGESPVVAQSLAKLGELIPHAVTLSSIVVDKRQLVISGVAHDRGEVSELVERISKNIIQAGAKDYHTPIVTVERLAAVEVEGLSLQEFVLRAVFGGSL